MDILTQSLLGGVLAQSVARKTEKKVATLAGLFAGLLADADILIRSAEDPLLSIEYHRHFTHSLLFIPLGAAVAALILWPLLRHHLSFKRLYLFCLAGFSLSGVLDALTSYGTLLFWPFSEQRIALNLIAIVDPVFTLILLIGLLLGLWLPGRRVALVVLPLCAGYLGFAGIQQQRAQEVMAELTAERSHEPRRHVVKPTLGNLLLWRSVYRHEERIYVDAVRVGLLAENRIYPGDSVVRFNRRVDLPKLDAETALARDIQRFERFSDCFVALDPGQENVLGDMRYSMLPAGVRPLWGIEFDAGEPHSHVEYRFFRDSSPQLRETFMAMLLGRCDVADCQLSPDK
ncbi:metal-dependent hydrolase [Thiohalophilus thiocyanatoxydans]|uniref:Inner membrane protein n=1 Tax=Thiohalophilus thiocyanatoxydans TaxID=381308 RepID=A0A4R8IXK1_9GAMM|nr:metal-dependent hydrolase [Thiohalophilus thiocyanatoxydans]TDY02519.1 inner membrane protein [Thiohalophilus thiocyanatoxydans]